MTYDEIQMAAVLVTCSRCDQAYYMTKPQAICIKCRQQLAREHMADRRTRA